MLNISNNSVSDKIDSQAFSALKAVEAKVSGKVLIKSAKWALLGAFIVALLPWTQNVRTNGTLTTLEPNQRPQEIHSVISGRIEEWRVREGQFVIKGDTIAIISEIKDAYFDDNLLERTENQLDLKKQSVDSYAQKIDAQNSQLSALQQRLSLESDQNRIKIKQLILKTQNDSLDYVAATLDNSIAQYQFKRMDSLYNRGLKSLVDLETRKTNAQQAQAKEVTAKNRWLADRNELLNLRIEQGNIQAKFESEYAKTMSDKFTTQTDKFDTESSVNKLENEFSNYEARRGFQIIRAPQNGFVTKLLVQGVGETVKEGDPVFSFMPQKYQLAVEMYVDPIDLPLMHVGEHVQLQFDGWPAIVFSGWPGASYGTYDGQIYAIDQFISENGKYRILVQPDITDHKWPEELRVGGGVKSMILLNDVPIWYELWRQINGFPPDFYKPIAELNKNKKK